MLRNLTVSNFALVEQLDIEFGPAFTVITGESGAGKSILLGALGLVLGERADSGSIRPGASRCEVGAEFSLGASPVARAMLDERGLLNPDDPDIVLLRRQLNRDSRSRAFINGSPVTVQDLGELAAELIDVHSQNAHQSLLRRDVQLALLDDYAGLSDLRRDTGDAFRHWQQALQTLEALQQNLERTADRMALLEYQVGELEALDLEDGEFEALDARHRRLAKSQDIEQRIGQALALLEGEQESGLQDLQQLSRLLAGIQDDQSALNAGRELLQGALNHLDEAATELRHYLDALQSEPEALAELESRLEAILDLARKHKVRPETLVSLTRDLRTELDSLALDRSNLPTLAARAREAEAGYEQRASELSRQRRSAAPAFEAEVGEVMNQLGIQGGALQLIFHNQRSDTGLESVDYLVVTNPKYPAAPLNKVASGGERSRISLAIDVIAAARSQLPTLVLDEADVGVGGATADVVGRLLRRIAEQAQVICVTHAPQVAALGQQHLSVRKTAEQDTSIQPIDKNQRIDEIARMLGGKDITAKTRELAAELIEAGAQTSAPNGERAVPVQRG